ncbi:MAG TPA: HAMP domain-containing sensor histidine kinase [Patescibacteria group bacterium]|nr:HAMP domain-containing sensor histidine kinase [Patescibacteria group bacterium]
MHRSSLRLKFFVILLVLLLTVFGSITFFIVRKNTNTLRSQLLAQSKTFAALATQPIGENYVIFQDSGVLKIKDEISSFTDLDHNISHVEIIDTNSNILFQNSSKDSVKISKSDAVNVNETLLKDSNGNVTAIIEPYLEAFGIHKYDIVYSISYASINQDINSIVRTIVIASLVILFASLFVWYFVLNSLFVSPVNKVSRIALKISRGELGNEIKITRKDEIGDLATAVNTMANSLKADIEKLKLVDQLKSEFLMIISHNLRTPLTIIKGYLDNLLASRDSEEEVETQIKIINSNVSRLSHFAEDALLISSMEGTQTTITSSSLEISKFLSTIVNEFKDLASQKGINFDCTIDQEIWVNANKAYLSSAIWNLIDNAYKFTSKGGSIKLSSKIVEGLLNITISDSGIGISDEEKEKMFTKFHRGTSTLQYKYEGTGIGLYLTKLIIDRQGGKIDFHSKQGEGSTFIISLPTISKPEKLP